jgi:hypothetical protein
MPINPGGTSLPEFSKKTYKLYKLYKLYRSGCGLLDAAAPP